MFAALYERVMNQEIPHKGLLLRGDASDLQQGTTLLMGAIEQGKREVLSSLSLRGLEEKWSSVRIYSGQHHIKEIKDLFLFRLQLNACRIFCS